MYLCRLQPVFITTAQAQPKLNEVLDEVVNNAKALYEYETGEGSDTEDYGYNGGQRTGDPCNPLSDTYGVIPCPTDTNGDTTDDTGNTDTNPEGDELDAMGIQWDSGPCDINSSTFDTQLCDALLNMQIDKYMEQHPSPPDYCNPESPDFNEAMCGGDPCDPASLAYNPHECGDVVSGGTLCDDCLEFIKWIKDHTLAGTGTYFDNTKQLQSSNATSCSVGSFKCLSNSKWYVDGNSKYFYHEGLLGIDWKLFGANWYKYEDCNVDACSFDFTKNVTPQTNPNNKEHWCVFFTLAAVSEKTACEIADHYYSQHWIGQHCDFDKGVDHNQAYLEELFTFCGLSYSAVGSNLTKCDITTAINDGGVIFDTQDASHGAAVLGIHRDDKLETTIDMFTTNYYSNVFFYPNKPLDWYQEGDYDYILH